MSSMMNNDELLKDLHKLADLHYKEANKINYKIRELEEFPLGQSLVGKCFKCLISSSGSSKKSFMYCRVIKYIKVQGLRVNSFQNDAYGEITFQYNNWRNVNSFSNPAWVSIDLKEYLMAEKRIINKLLKRHRENGEKSK